MPIYWVGPAGMTAYTSPGLPRIGSVGGVSATGAVQRISGRTTGFAEQRARVAYQRQQEPPPPKPVFYVGDTMTTEITTLAPAASIEEAVELFRTRRFRHVPIVEGQVLVGILSDRDILRGVGNSDRRETIDTTPETVGDLMSTELLTASKDTPLREAARVMADERLSALPVINDEHHLLGILTTSDLLRCIVEQPGLELWA